MPALQSDGGQISQVLNNLIANALQFTPRGGRVMVLAESTPTEVVVSVSDNGPGVPREQWDRIFDRFTQVNPSFTDVAAGVGVGLFVVRELVDHLGGRIWLDSEVGKGSEFCVAFPRVPAAVERNGQAARGRVLVCDADAELASKIIQLLRQHGLATDVAYTGRRVLEKISERDYDVVLTDLLFRDLGPEQLLPQLTRAKRRYRLIAHAHGPEATELRARGFDIVLGRPAEREELVQAVEMALQVKPNCATILIAAASDDPLAEYAQHLAERGNLPVLAPSLREAAGQLTDYPFDRVLISSRLLDGSWSELAMFEQHALPTGALVVVCAQLGRAERAQADEWGVGAATLNALRKTLHASPAAAVSAH